MKQNMIKEDQPVYKALTNGVCAVSDVELISLIIGDNNTLELSRKLQESCINNLHQLGKMNYSELRRIGLTERKAINLLASLELGRRRTDSEPMYQQKISSSKDVYAIMSPILKDLPHEEFWVIILDRNNKVMDKIRISQGGISGTVIDTRLILRNALERLASGLILCHNHPSGNNQPSDADTKITEKIKSAAAFMEINVLDHIIIADKQFYSFADEGIM